MGRDPNQCFLAYPDALVTKVTKVFKATKVTKVTKVTRVTEVTKVIGVTPSSVWLNPVPKAWVMG